MGIFDNLYKRLIAIFFWEFLDLFAVELLSILDVDKGYDALKDKELFDESDDETISDSHHVDVVVKASLKHEQSFVLVHVEAQSNWQANYPQRQFHYFARLFEKYNLLIYPIVLFSFDSPLESQPKSFELHLADMKVLFNYRVIQLNCLDWHDYAEKPHPIAAALLLKMGVAPEDHRRVTLICLDMLYSLQLQAAHHKVVSRLILLYSKLTYADIRELEIELSKYNKSKREAIMEVMTDWKKDLIKQGVKKGVEQGIEQGIEKGIEKGIEQEHERGRLRLAAVVIRLLKRRLGELPESAIENIQKLQAEQLELLSEDLLDFSKTKDLSNWLGKQRV